MNFIDKVLRMFKGGSAPFTHAEGSRRPATRRLSTTPGYAKRFVKHVPNPLKKATKPCNPGMPRTFGVATRGRWPAPTHDQVRHAEKVMGIRLNVKEGRVSSRDGDDHGLDWHKVNEAILNNGDLASVLEAA